MSGHFHLSSVAVLEATMVQYRGPSTPKAKGNYDRALSRKGLLTLVYTPKQNGLAF